MSPLIHFFNDHMTQCVNDQISSAYDLGIIVFGSRFSFSFSHFCFASPLKSLGIVSTGMLLSAQNLRHNRKRASCCPVSSEISLVTFGFSSATLTLPYSVQPCWQLFHSVASFPPRVYPPANMKG